MLHTQCSLLQWIYWWHIELFLLRYPHKTVLVVIAGVAGYTFAFFVECIVAPLIPAKHTPLPNSESQTLSLFSSNIDQSLVLYFYFRSITPSIILSFYFRGSFVCRPLWSLLHSIPNICSAYFKYTPLTDVWTPYILVGPSFPPDYYLFVFYFTVAELEPILLLLHVWLFCRMHSCPLNPR